MYMTKGVTCAFLRLLYLPYNCVDVCVSVCLVNGVCMRVRIFHHKNRVILKKTNDGIRGSKWVRNKNKKFNIKKQNVRKKYAFPAEKDGKRFIGGFSSDLRNAKQQQQQHKSVFPNNT